MAAAVAIPEVEQQVSTGTFDVTVDQKELAIQLAAVRDAVPGKVTIPILSNLLLTAKDDRLTIVATDLDVTVRVSMEARVAKPGTCTVPGRKLHDYVKLLPGGDVRIELQDNHWIKVRAGRSNTKMVGLPPSNFPAQPIAPTEDFGVSASSLLRMIEMTSFAVSTEASRYTLAGALFVVRPDRLEMVATDGHRLARANEVVDTAVFAEKRMLVPHRAMILARKMFADATTPIFIAEDASRIFLQTKTRTLIAAKIVGSFPNYEAAIPKNSTPGVVLESATILPAVERSMVFTDERTGALAMEWSENLLCVRAAAADAGESQEELDIYGGPAEPVRIGLSAEYVRQGLRLMSGQFILFLTDARSAVLIEHATDDGFLFQYVVMPMSLGGSKAA